MTARIFHSLLNDLIMLGMHAYEDLGFKASQAFTDMNSFAHTVYQAYKRLNLEKTDCRYNHVTHILL